MRILLKDGKGRESMILLSDGYTIIKFDVYIDFDMSRSMICTPECTISITKKSNQKLYVYAISDFIAVDSSVCL